jgi:putative NADH-flavin reductase
MKIALFGATGLTGPSVLKEALARGHDVVVLARKPEAVTTKHDKLTIVKGDATSTADVEGFVKGCDAVVHCLGVGGKGDGKPNTLVSDSVKMLIPIMKAQNVKRLVAMSNLGAGGSGQWFVRKVAMPLFVRWLIPIVQDKDRMEAILRESDIEWVAVRLPGIVEGESKPLKTSADGSGRGVSWKITTGSVATFMLDQLADGTYLGKTPAVSN